MTRASQTPDWQYALIALTGTVIGVVAVAVLYWGRSVLIPLALAIQLTFILSPLVIFLQRRRFGRIPAVILVVAFAALFLGGIGWVVTRQVTSLLTELPQYTDNIKNKIQTIQQMAEGTGGQRLQQMVEDIAELFRSKRAFTPATPGPTGPGERSHPVTVVVEQPTGSTWLNQVPALLNDLVEILGQAALALILVVFMLLKREDLRNRFIRLVGHGRMTVTTKAVDDAATRVSRYLLMQLMINTTYGMALGAGLYFLGVPHAFLWGFIAAVLRYVPYIGAPVAALFPITLSIAMSQGWSQPSLVIGLVLVLELISNNFMEPYLYGHSIGVSEVAQLVAAALWAFLWGPVGLVLSGPLTVCVLVLGKYVPHLEFLDVLLGDEPPLAEDVLYYQRLTARDQDEATDIVLSRLQAASAEAIYDDLLIPALHYAKRDHDRSGLTDNDLGFIAQATREILEDLGEQAEVANAATPTTASGEPLPPKVQVLACPAHDEADRLALEMLQLLLNPQQWELNIMPEDALKSEVVSVAEKLQPSIICISSLPPGGLAHTRYLCKRLRTHFPQAKIVVGRWGLESSVEENQQQLQAAGADRVETQVLRTRQYLQSLLPVLEQEVTSRHGTQRARRQEATV